MALNQQISFYTLIIQKLLHTLIVIDNYRYVQIINNNMHADIDDFLDSKCSQAIRTSSGETEMMYIKLCQNPLLI